MINLNIANSSSKISEEKLYEIEVNCAQQLLHTHIHIHTPNATMYSDDTFAVGYKNT